MKYTDFIIIIIIIVTQVFIFSVHIPRDYEVCSQAGLRLIHGNPRHPQSQGSADRANGGMNDILGT